MKPAKAIARFFLLLGLSYTLLILPWLGLRPTYARFFRAANQFVLGSFGRDGVVRLVPTKEAADALDSELVLRNRTTGITMGAEISSNVGYSPAAFFTALLIATPLPFRRRAGAFVWGMLLIHAAVTLTLFLRITLAFGTNSHIATFSMGEFAQTTLAGLIRLVLFVPFFSLVTPIFIWILVTFRTEDLDLMVHGPPRSPSAHNQHSSSGPALPRGNQNRPGRRAWMAVK